jgi:hypothetical protein
MRPKQYWNLTGQTLNIITPYPASRAWGIMIWALVDLSMWPLSWSGSFCIFPQHTFYFPGISNFLGLALPSQLHVLLSWGLPARVPTLPHIPFLFFWPYWIWLGTSHLLSRCSTTWATPPALFVLSIFKINSHELFAWAVFKPWSSWSLPPE